MAYPNVPLRPDAWIRVEGTYPQNNFISLLREHVRSTEATKTPVLSWAGLIPRDRLFAGYHLKMRFLHKSTRAVYRSMDLPTCLTVTMHKRIDGAVDFVSDLLTQAASRYHVLSPVVSHLTIIERRNCSISPLCAHVVIHGLRHTHASHLLKQNVHMKIASERLGHSSINITMDLYSHLLDGMDAEAASKVDEALRAAMNKPKG